VQNRRRALIEWVGADGSVWELSNWKSGVFLTQGGVEGLSRPQHTDWIAPLSPAIHGQDFTGYVVEPRKVFWPIYLYADGGSAEFRSRDRAFWETMRPDTPGVWRYTSEGETRELVCRFQDDGGHAYNRDPHYFGWATYGISLVADDPFWKGAPIERTFKDDEPVNFYGGPALKGPPFYISSASRMANAKMTNPGDVEAWPVWTVTGPAENTRLGVGGRQVTVPFKIIAGQTLTIDTDPLDQTAWLDGVDVTDRLGDYDFAPIPRGKDEALSLFVEGSGTVTARIVPRYDRAW